MKTHFDIEKIEEKGVISNELDYDRALIADRKLRLLAKENVYFKNLGLDSERVASDYLKMIKDMRTEGLYFYKHGKYRSRIIECSCDTLQLDGRTREKRNCSPLPCFA